MSSPGPKPAMPSRSSATPSPAPSASEGRSPEDQEVEEQDADLPLTMAASVVLTSLPKDAHEALEAVGKEGVGEKGLSIVLHYLLYVSKSSNFHSRTSYISIHTLIFRLSLFQRSEDFSCH